MAHDDSIQKLRHYMQAQIYLLINHCMLGYGNIKFLKRTSVLVHGFEHSNIPNLFDKIGTLQQSSCWIDKKKKKKADQTRGRKKCSKTKKEVALFQGHMICVHGACGCCWSAKPEVRKRSWSKANHFYICPSLNLMTKIFFNLWLKISAFFPLPKSCTSSHFSQQEEYKNKILGNDSQFNQVDNKTN